LADGPSDGGKCPDDSPNFSRAAHQRSEGTMRSINSRNRNLGISKARLSAKSIAGRAMDRASMLTLAGAFMAASRLWHSLWGSGHTPMVTPRVSTRVTGGTLYALGLQRPGQHAACCPAAR
jgi:hypothetical protein